MSTKPIVFALYLGLGACGPAPGTRPHEMSRTAHLASADAEQAASDTCAAGGAQQGPCWTGDAHPSERRRAEMQEHARLAAAHRAAAAALRDAEEHTCVGLTAEERDESPFEHRQDIGSVRELRDTVRAGRAETHPLVGATVVFRAVRGLTAEWLQRVVDCHLARNAALGHEVPEMPSCPLVPPGVTARVSSVGDGFAVDVRADTTDGATEVLRRAQSLLSESGR